MFQSQKEAILAKEAETGVRDIAARRAFNQALTGGERRCTTEYIENTVNTANKLFRMGKCTSGGCYWDQDEAKCYTEKSQTGSDELKKDMEVIQEGARRARDFAKSLPAEQAALEEKERLVRAESARQEAEIQQALANLMKARADAAEAAAEAETEAQQKDDEALANQLKATAEEVKSNKQSERDEIQQKTEELRIQIEQATDDQEREELQGLLDRYLSLLNALSRSWERIQASLKRTLTWWSQEEEHFKGGESRYNQAQCDLITSKDAWSSPVVRAMPTEEMVCMAAHCRKMNAKTDQERDEAQKIIDEDCS